MNHSFDVDIATKYGILEAILLNSINYWLLKNEANEKNYFDGHYWTYNSTRAFSELFPYASQRQIQTALKKLINEGILVTGNYNKYAYDHTLWYRFTDKGKSIMRKSKIDCTENVNRLCENVKSTMQKCKIDCTENANRFTQDVKPIPNINTNINTDKKPDIKKEIYKEKNRFVKPTIEEIKEYVFENSLNVDCEYFYDYYQSNGWTVGKNHMKDWKATARNWSRRNQKNVVTKKSDIEEWLEIGARLDEQERNK